MLERQTQGLQQSCLKLHKLINDLTLSQAPQTNWSQLVPILSDVEMGDRFHNFMILSLKITQLF